MSINTTCKWDVRTTGNNTNGGGFTSGGTDFSQQDIAQITFTDLEVKNGVYNRIYSALQNSNLTSDCIGNIIYISGGTGFITGWYEVTGQGNDGNNYLDIDRNCNTGNQNDGSAKLGGSLADLSVDSFLEQLEPGHKVYIKSGYYDQTASGINMAKDGFTYAPIIFIGYNSTHGDDPIGNNRPQIDGGSNRFVFDNYIGFRNMRFTSSVLSNQTLTIDHANVFENNEIINTNTTQGGGLSLGYGSVVNCYFESLKGIGVFIQYGSISYCYSKALHPLYLYYGSQPAIQCILHGTGEAGG